MLLCDPAVPANASACSVFKAHFVMGKGDEAIAFNSETAENLNTTAIRNTVSQATLV
jgi:hypothetical protein